ncbi:hypothetical protein H6G17_06285 [Chroococcidiopsis sp. FACHB-1243]|nr:hypothetical protein [Chroococcidiopsis sp. [FACHB-1243]]
MNPLLNPPLHWYGRVLNQDFFFPGMNPLLNPPLHWYGRVLSQDFFFLGMNPLLNPPLQLLLSDNRQLFKQ